MSSADRDSQPRRRSRRRAVLSALALTAALTSVGVAQAADGELDPTFSGDGIVSGPADAIARDIAIDSKGRIVTGGWAGGTGFGAVRYLPSGAVDTSFSGDGQAGVPLSDAKTVVVDSADRVLVGGYDRSGFAIARFTPTGAPDTSFSGDGVATLKLGSNDYAYINELALDSRGRIIAAGYSSAGIAVARFTAAGAPDTSFSGNGWLTIDLRDGSYANGVIADAQDRVLVVGASERTTPRDKRFAVLRFTAGGRPDSSFSGDGLAMTPIGDRASAEAVAITQRGRIIAGGSSSVGNKNNDFALAQYTPAGNLDTSFSGDGKRALAIGPDTSDDISDLAIDARGRIVAIGSTGHADQDFAVARLNQNGGLDTSFSGDGKVVTDLGADDAGNGGAIDAQGRIVVGGEISGGPVSEWAVGLTRYTAAP